MAVAEDYCRKFGIYPKAIKAEAVLNIPAMNVACRLKQRLLRLLQSLGLLDGFSVGSNTFAGHGIGSAAVPALLLCGMFLPMGVRLSLVVRWALLKLLWSDGYL